MERSLEIKIPKGREMCDEGSPFIRRRSRRSESIYAYGRRFRRVWALCTALLEGMFVGLCITLSGKNFDNHQSQNASYPLLPHFPLIHLHRLLHFPTTSSTYPPTSSIYCTASTSSPFTTSSTYHFTSTSSKSTTSSTNHTISGTSSFSFTYHTISSTSTISSTYHITYNPSTSTIFSTYHTASYTSSTSSTSSTPNPPTG
ncbi:cell wall protein DAN4-like [Penaeus japonicus]|uniref:cell wall protein DAN4-like n=1 Tax=Penaeus japonicus TaxID=27405 RepID=UPI001C7179BF|nr:cell wall protein DAN4-like [Penaeus japonicus]XP_042875244.1 cell wall protein DAN4-like [Penaeus japonicus]